jgi:hypothetical protein
MKKDKNITNRYFGLSQGDGEVEEQKPGFFKGMLLKKKYTKEDKDKLDTSHIVPREIC